MLKAVIFDMNGVIIDDERIHQESWRQLCRKHNINLSEEDFKHYVFGRRESDTFSYLFKRQLTDEEIKLHSAERIEIAITIFKPKLALTQGLLDFLNNLHKAHIPLAIATSARWPYTNFILDNLQIRHFFKVVVTAEDVTHGKPDPEAYVLAAEELRVKPKFCVVFEDSLSGIKSAKAAGMKVIGITTTHSPEELEIADKIIHSFTDITIANLKELL